MKIRPVVAELFRVDGQTDVTKLIVYFLNFANAPKNDICQINEWSLLIESSLHPSRLDAATNVRNQLFSWVEYCM